MFTDMNVSNPAVHFLLFARTKLLYYKTNVYFNEKI